MGTLREWHFVSSHFASGVAFGKTAGCLWLPHSQSWTLQNALAMGNQNLHSELLLEGMAPCLESVQKVEVILHAPEAEHFLLLQYLCKRMPLVLLCSARSLVPENLQSMSSYRFVVKPCETTPPAPNEHAPVMSQPVQFVKMKILVFNAYKTTTQLE
jgi:hypothetical protein